MTQHIDVYTTDSTIDLPDNLVSANLAVTAIGGPGEPGVPGAYVQGQIATSLFPLTAYIGQSGASGDGGAGYSGGGAGNTYGGGGSTAVLSGSTLLIEAAGADAENLTDIPGGTAGGYASNTPPDGLVSDQSAGSGGSQGGTGGDSGSGNAGGAGEGGGTSGNAGSGTTSGPGVGSGGLLVTNRAFSFAAASVTGYQYGASPSTARPIGSVTVVYDVADAPNAPTPVAPVASSFLDANADGITFSGTYQTPGADTGALVGVALGVKQDSGSYGYWDGTDFSSPTAIYITPDTGVGATNGESFTVVIPAGVLADGHDYTYILACEESFADLDGAFSTGVEFTAQVAPTVAITAPSGSQNTQTPGVAWTPTTPAGSQTDYRFVLYATPTDAPGTGVPTYDTGLVSGAGTSFTIGATLDSPGTYYGYLQITETGGQTSEWTPVPVEVQLVETPAPTLTAVLATDPVTGSPCVKLTLTGGWTGGTLAQFQVSTDGETWSDIVNSFTPLADALAGIYDLSGPFNVELYYQARLLSAVDQFEVTPWSNVVDSLVVPSLYWWMVPSDPAMSIQLKRIRSTVTTNASTSDTAVTMPAIPAGLSASLIVDEPEQQGRFNGFGRKNAVVVHGDLWSEEFVLNIYFDGEADFQAFRAIRNLQEVVLLKSDMSGDTYWVSLGSARPTAILSESERQSDPKRGLSIQCIPADPALV